MEQHGCVPQKNVNDRNNRAVGNYYETLATEYLVEHGYRILERNFHSRFGEIDIIAQKEGDIIFVECKYRSGEGFGDPLAAVDLKKQRRICKTALFYYTRHGYSMDCSCRFDVVAIYPDNSIVHIENAFEFVS